MLFLICCVWIASGVLGYVLIKRDFTRYGVTWLNKDRVLWSVLGVLIGPMLLGAGLVLLFGALVVKIAPEWFGRPSRW